ncbi:MAG: 50S ribosomal protein L17 [Calditrichaeota bacterium]|nr:MAG: 50S ribosomal protein L17 [Calditrichota bacterium]
MRHRKAIKKLGRTASHRKALLRNLARAMVEHHQIKTTLAKAKAAQGYIERLITYAKQDTVHARRLAFKHLQSRTLVKKLFDEIGPTFADRNGGYTRVVKLGHRRGDGAELAVLQLVGFETTVVEEKPAKKKKAKPSKPKAEKPTEEKKAKKAAKPAKEKAEAPAEPQEEVKPEVQPEEKPAAEEKPAEETAKAPAEASESGEAKPAEDQSPEKSSAEGEEEKKD